MSLIIIQKLSFNKYYSFFASMEAYTPDKESLIKLANTRMPFGKYKGWYLVDIPEPYYVWFRQKGFPSGQFGEQLLAMYDIKVNGLEPLLKPLIRR